MRSTLICSESHYQASDHIAEERRQACLGGIKQLQAHNSAKHSVKDFDSDFDELFADCCWGLELNNAVEERSVQNNLYLVREIIEGIKDNTNAVLISLEQSKAFGRVTIDFGGGFGDCQIRTGVPQMDWHAVP